MQTWKVDFIGHGIAFSSGAGLGESLTSWNYSFDLSWSFYAAGRNHFTSARTSARPFPPHHRCCPCKCQLSGVRASETGIEQSNADAIAF
jgi:hypothetical protein